MDDNSFTRQLREVAKKFETLDDSQVNIDRFFQVTDSRSALPQDSNPQTVEALLASSIYLIARKQKTDTVRAIRTMLKYLRNDPSVFARLKPNKILLRKMNLERHFLSNGQE